MVSAVLYFPAFFHFSGGWIVLALTGYNARIKSSKAVMDPFNERAAIIGSGAPSAYFGEILWSSGYICIHRLDGTPVSSAHFPAILSDSQFAFVIWLVARDFLSWPLTHLMVMPAISICGLGSPFRSSTVATLNICRSYSACSSWVRSSSLSGVVQCIVSSRSFRRYSISVHRFLFGLWHLSVAVSNNIVGVLLIGANASRYILPFTLSGIIRMASHKPPVSPIALEYDSADGGDNSRPPYLIYAIGLPLCTICPTPP